MPRNLKTIALLLAIPIIPFLLCGWYLEPQIEGWLKHAGVELPPVSASLAGVGLLVADIFLPVPSSAVGTFLGAVLGGFWGSLVTWCGLNLGAWLGYELARWARSRRSTNTPLDPGSVRVRQLNRRLGGSALAVCRGLPVLAEASVLAAGMSGIPRRAFWVVVGPANLGLAIAYAVLGATSTAGGWLPLALGLSLGLPAAALWLVAGRSSENVDSRYD